MSEHSRDTPEIAPITGPISSDRAWALMLSGVMFMALPSILSAWIVVSIAQKLRDSVAQLVLRDASALIAALQGLGLIVGAVAFFRVGWKLFQQGRTAPRTQATAPCAKPPA